MPKILNFKFTNHYRPELEITYSQAKAAFLIYAYWKVNKLLKIWHEEGIFLANFTQRNSLENLSDVQDENHIERKSDLAIYDRFKDAEIDEEDDLKQGIEKYNELNFEESADQLSEWELKSFKEHEELKEFSTVRKEKSEKSPEIQDVKSETDSEVTKIIIKSTKDVEEIKEMEEGTLTRELEAEGEGNEEPKLLSNINPFEGMEETIDNKEKIVHLSTINTNENFNQEELLNDLSGEIINEENGLDSEEAAKAMDDLAGSGSVIKVISRKDEQEESEPSDK